MLYLVIWFMVKKQTKYYNYYSKFTKTLRWNTWTYLVFSSPPAFLITLWSVLTWQPKNKKGTYLMTFFLSDVTGKNLIEHFDKNIFICFFTMEHLFDMFFVKTNISCLHCHGKIFFRLILIMDSCIVIAVTAIKNVQITETFCICLQVIKSKFKHLSNSAKTPIRATAFSASYDLFLAQ